MNYFNLFNLPINFNIDQKSLTKSFYALQKKYHPDFFIFKSKKDKIKNMEKSILINTAYSTLSNPILRAKYLLKLNNVYLNKKENNFDTASFLSQQLDLYEEFEKIKKQLKNKKENLFIFLKKIESLVNSNTLNIENQFREKQWNCIQSTLYKLHFFLKLKNIIFQEIKSLDE